MSPRIALPAILAIALPTLAGPSPRPADEIGFQPAPGTALQKIFRTYHELSLEQIARAIGSGQFMARDLGGFISTEELIVVHDQYRVMGPGRPDSLLRTYQHVRAKGKATLTGPKGSKLEDLSASGSPFELRRVLFSWIEEEGQHARRFDGVDGPEDILLDVREDMDARSALPAGPVEVGDTWQLDQRQLGILLAPGGDLKLIPRKFSEFARTMKLGCGGSMWDILGPDTVGSATCRYAGVREEEGVSVAVIEISELVLSSIKDQTAAFEDSMPTSERQEPGFLEQVVVDFSVVGGGEILWNQEAGHLHSMSIQGEERISLTVTKTFLDTEEPYNIVERSATSGGLTMEVECKTAPPAEEDPFSGKQRSGK